MTAVSRRLTAATIATYAVVVFGATLASQGGAGAGLDGAPSFLAVGHGLAAALAALFLALAAWTAPQVEISGRLRVLRQADRVG